VEATRRNVLLLAACQGLLLTNAVTLISVGGLAGYALAEHKSLATLPQTSYVIGAALATLPASFFMKRVGRRKGFIAGTAIGLLGAAIATAAIAAQSFALLCLGHVLLGMYNAFGQYYRFAAADSATPDFKAKAISLVLAGGLLGGIIGPELTKVTIDLAAPTYLATYASLLVFGAASMAVISFLSVPPMAEAPSSDAGRSLGELVSQPRFIVAVLVAASGYAVMNFLMTATPLAMRFCGHPYGAAAGVISAHVIAMFAPSFVTGSLVQRFGSVNVMLTGVAAMLACVATALAGQDMMNFWWALVLLGIGWNFMYVGGSTLLTETYRPAEKARAQGLNEFIVFGVQAISSFSSGFLVSAAGWNTMNYIGLPIVLLAGASLVWLKLARR
jgi:MFS family permease